MPLGICNTLCLHNCRENPPLPESRFDSIRSLISLVIVGELHRNKNRLISWLSAWLRTTVL